jgi:hypothetical protein
MHLGYQSGMSSSASDCGKVEGLGQVLGRSAAVMHGAAWQRLWSIPAA